MGRKQCATNPSIDATLDPAAGRNRRGGENFCFHLGSKISLCPFESHIKHIEWFLLSLPLVVNMCTIVEYTYCSFSSQSNVSWTKLSSEDKDKQKQVSEQSFLQLLFNLFVINIKYDLNKLENKNFEFTSRISVLSPRFGKKCQIRASPSPSSCDTTQATALGRRER